MIKKKEQRWLAGVPGTGGGRRETVMLCFLMWVLVTWVQTLCSNASS